MLEVEKMLINGLSYDKILMELSEMDFPHIPSKGHFLTG